MDGIGASIKRTIDDAIAFNPNAVIRCTNDLIKFLPDSDIKITTYKKSDVDYFMSMVPKGVSIKCKQFGISKFHEIKYSMNKNNIIHWKMLSEDDTYTEAKLQEKRLVS